MSLRDFLPVQQLAALALVFSVCSALAQLPPTPPNQPQFPPRQRNQPLQPSIPFDQLGRMPTPNASALSATAAFEPPVLRLMRFGEYRITILGAVSGIELPDPLPGPEGLILDLTNKLPGSTIVNGQRVASMTFRYTVTASRPGTFLMPSFTATVQGQPVSVPAAQVVAQEPGPDDLPYQPVKAVLDLGEGEYFVGQMLPARLLVFDTPDETVQAIANVTKPSGDFLFQSQSGSRRERVQWQGKPQSALVTPLRLTPIKPGESDVSLQAIVFINKLNAIGRMSGNTAQAMLDTAPVHVRVRALPEAGRKPGFTGAIGKFELVRPTLSASEAIVGDPITLTVTLSGEGNLEAIGAPVLEASETWQSFTPTMTVDRDVFSGRGTKTITYTLIPRKADTRAVPAIPFSYFDPERKEYIDLSIPPQPVSVKPSGETPAPVATATPAPTAPPESAPKRVEPILTGLAEMPGTWRSSPSPIAWSRAFWAGQAVPAIALLGLWLRRRRIDFLAAHPEVVRRRVARIAAKRHLQVARTAARSNDADGFVSASINAIRAAIAPLDTTEAQSIVMEDVLAKLPRENHADAAVRELFQCEHAKDFSGHTAPLNGVTELLPHVEKAVAMIERAQP